MTELEKIEYAKSFIDKLANGINPLDDSPIPDNDIANNVRLSRCFFYNIAASKTHDETTINEETVASYVNALRKIFVVEDMPAWNPNLRSKTAIRSSDTRYYIDPSIAAAALGIGPNDLVNV